MSVWFAGLPVVWPVNSLQHPAQIAGKHAAAFLQQSTWNDKHVFDVHHKQFPSCCLANQWPAVCGLDCWKACGGFPTAVEKIERSALHRNTIKIEAAQLANDDSDVGEYVAC